MKKQTKGILAFGFLGGLMLTSGVLIADRPGKITTYASLGMVDRGELYLEVGTEVYKGMILGKRNRPDDLDVNITK